MPRDRRANIGTGIWSETSMRALTRRQRDAYMLVYTQPDLTRCGVLPYRLRYWAMLAVDSTEEQLAEDFRDLHNSRHVVVDEPDEQLFIRTYVKHDGLLSQPLVVASMIRDYHKITSPVIRLAFLVELRRLWDDPELEPKERQGLSLVLGATPTDVGVKDDHGRIATAIGAGLAGKLIGAIRDGQVDPFNPKGLPKGLTEALREGLTKGPDKGPPEGPGKGQGNPPVDPPRANAFATAPAPATAPATATATVATRDPDDPTSTLIGEHIAAYTQPPPPSAIIPVKREVMRLVAEHVPPDRIRAGLARLRERRLAASLLPQLVAETSPVTQPSTTDARVAQGLRLVERYEAAGE